MSIINRFAVILCGYEFIPHSVSYDGGGDRFWHAVPVCAYLLDTDEGYIVVEGGLDERKLREPVLRERYFPQRAGYPTPLVAPQHEILPQLAAMGVRAEDVAHIIQTHLHADHTGHTLSFPNARVYIQRADYDYARQQSPVNGYIPEEFDVPADRLKLLDGDTILFPGLELVYTPGHSPGHQSPLLTLKDSRRFLLVGDVVDDRRNMDEDILPGGMTNREQARASMKRIRSIMDGGVTGIFLHDAGQVRELALAPEWV